MRLQYSNVRGKQYNTSYPFSVDVKSVEDLKRVAVYDHLCANYADGYNTKKVFIKGYRSNKTFKGADCLPQDCDNVLSDPLAPDIPPSEWKTPADVHAAFPNVEFYVVYSRNHMKEKGGKSPRPKFHVYFPLRMMITNARMYNELKKKVRTRFPAFDDRALDSARFLYGVENPVVEHYDGDMFIDDFINERQTKIVEGARNSSMSHYAGIVLKKMGSDDGRAYAAFMERAQCCEPPLDDSELASIWRSALGFYENTVKTDPEYIPPSEYENMDFEDTYIPDDFTDVGQAKAFLKSYQDKVIYVRGLGLLYYTGIRWRDEEMLVQKALQDFTYKQLGLAWKMRNNAESDNDAEKAEAFYKFVLSRRKSSNIKATMNEIKPMVQMDIKKIDADGFILNTPDGTVDLRTGVMRAHDPKDYCTKTTAVKPSDKGMDEWLAFLEQFTGGDKELERYLQIESGIECIGEVLSENLAMETGSGGNGKSTFNNSKFYCLGDYAGTVAAELLTMNSARSNKGAELAELRGKRFIIAAELREGARLDTSALKNLCSTDPIHAEKKFEAPFEFIPTHTAVLYTNHLPKVGTVDKGTWDRIVVIPLKANFRGMKGEIKNYANVLFENCGGAILKWMIEGARLYIENGCSIVQPDCVKQAIAEYRQENDWVTNFITECCGIKSGTMQKAGELYEVYRTYCDKMGEYKRSSSDFKKALEAAGYEYKRLSAGCFWFGLCLKNEYSVFPD